MSSLLYTQRLVAQLKAEEREKVELLAEATRQLIEMDISVTNFGFLLQIIENNNTVPVIMVDALGDTISTRNLDPYKLRNPNYIRRQLEIMANMHEPIEIPLSDGVTNYIYYRDSIILTKLLYFPYIQLAVILLFILVSYFAFSTSRKAEQNQVWLGLSKETAHQLGTPTSSLIAWIELLKIKRIDDHIVGEFEKDVGRLEKITERFSKIGSRPVLSNASIPEVVTNAVNYIQSRSSDKININLNFRKDDELIVPINTELFEWVIENLCKNAIDAMSGEGNVDITITDNTQVLYLDVRDYGTGIPKSRHKTIFKPGYTTKERGWGLGLSLTKRIIEMYHGGKIFVNHSEIHTGTTFRIVLKK
ncbi:MAG: HAMP domain-containing histidine kinase [Bacteroidales bacterium]|nr:MAG: HAMP domain-containing histidine kinase [Bacteroidales bacterium]